MKRVWSIAVLSLALAACSQIQYHDSSGYAPVTTLGYGADYWLNELHGTRQKTPAEVRQTVAEWEQALLDDPSDGNRIRLALLLLAGEISVRDPARARELLDELSQAPAETSDTELVALMRQVLDQQEQTSAEIDKLTDQLRVQKRRTRELEQQQRALTDIEQNIQQRTIQPDNGNGGE